MNGVTIVTSIIVPIIVAIISTLLTNYFQKKRDNKQNLESQYAKKPIFNMKKTIFRNESEIDINGVVLTFKTSLDNNNDVTFEYNDEILNSDKLKFIDLEFENIGINHATDFTIAICEQKHNALFEMDSIKEWMDSKFINYNIDLCNKSIIPVNEKIKIRINYLKDEEKSIYNLLAIYFDEYGNIWEQLIVLKSGAIEKPHKITWKAYRERTNPESALFCFEHPMMW